MDFLVTFGIFNAGEASMVTDTKIHSVGNEETIQIDVTGKSIGLFDLFTTVRDKWGVYITKNELEPKKFYKYLREGKYRKNEILNFVENRIKKQLKPFYKKRHIKKVDFETNVKKLTQKPSRGSRNMWSSH